MFTRQRLKNSKDSERIINLDELESENMDNITFNEKNKNDRFEEIISIKLSDNETDEKFIDTEEQYNKTDIKNNIKALLSKKRRRQNAPKKINIGLEFKLFYKLVEKYGIDKVLTSLSNTENNFSEKEIDRIINKINDTCGKEKFINNIIKTYFFLLKDYMNNNPEIKNALIEKNNNFDQQRILPKNTKIDNNQTMLDFQFNINNIIEIPLNKEEMKEKEYDDNNTNNNKEYKLSLESHYKKNLDGNIYKYKILYLLGKLAIFKCSDKDCNGDGIFDLETKKFQEQQKHSKKYTEHDFIIKRDLENEIIFKEMNINSKYVDAQILFEDNTKIVRFYC